MNFLNKEFYKKYLFYLIPVCCSFLFFWKLGESSFWFDELITLITVSENNLNRFFVKCFAYHLNPPLHLILLKFYLFVVGFLNDINNLLLIIVYPNLKTFDNACLFLQIPMDKCFLLHNPYFPNSIVRQLVFISETNLRLPSAVFLTVANVMVFDFFRKNKLLLIGLVVSLLIGTNSRLIYYAQEARPYALFILIFVLVLQEFYNSYSKELILSNFKRLMLYNILLVLTHYYGVFVVCSEIIILLVKNKKNKTFVVASITVPMVLVFLLMLVYKLLNLSDMRVFGKMSFSDIRSLHENALGYFIGWKFFLVGTLALLIKKFYKQISNADAIFIRASLLLIGALIMVFVFVSVRPIFNIRYMVFLIPLQILIIICIYYSISETIFLFVKNKTLKKIAVAAVFLMFTSILVIKQILFHFNVLNYYETQKYYPIKSAYSTITGDRDYKIGAHYVLEEYIGEIFKYYEQNFGLRQAINLDPKTNNSEKENKLSEAIGRLDENVFYYIRVRHKETSQQEESISLRQFSKKLIFKEQDIEAYKFTKEF